MYFIMLKFAPLLILLVSVESTFLSNVTDATEDEANPASWTEEGIWDKQLIEWTLGYKNNRESRVMQIPLTAEDAFIVARREDVKPMGKLVNNINLPLNTITGSLSSMRPGEKLLNGRQVTETDLYLLSAIEKLVYRADFMEKRLRRLEEMMYYVMAGSRVDKEPCPINFNRAGSNCYFFSDLAGRERDWKSAKKMCEKQGAVLAEMETIEENQDVVAHIQANSNLRGKDFWTGGLNPGLLWIWSNSARPVSADDRGAITNSTAKIRGDGRCLRLAYDPAIRHYAYKGTDCSGRYQFICETPDKTTSTKLNRLARERNIDLPEY